MSAMLQLSRVSAGYGSFQALFDVSLEVGAGESVAVIGPNGAGKSTLLRALLGLVPRRAGTVSVAGHDPAREPHRARERIGYVPDRPYLYEKLTGRELLHFVVDLYAKDWSVCEPRAVELLRYFGLGDWIDSRIENLSHGMKQKLVIENGGPPTYVTVRAEYEVSIDDPKNRAARDPSAKS